MALQMIPATGGGGGVFNHFGSVDFPRDSVAPHPLFSRPQWLSPTVPDELVSSGANIAEQSLDAMKNGMA